MKTENYMKIKVEANPLFFNAKKKVEYNEETGCFNWVGGTIACVPKKEHRRLVTYLLTSLFEMVTIKSDKQIVGKQREIVFRYMNFLHMPDELNQE